jgi:predicted nucleic acid-binding protein
MKAVLDANIWLSLLISKKLIPLLQAVAKEQVTILGLSQKLKK